MKIPILRIYKVKSHKRLSDYTVRLFKELEQDKKFESLYLWSRTNLKDAFSFGTKTDFTTEQITKPRNIEDLDIEYKHETGALRMLIRKEKHNVVYFRAFQSLLNGHIDAVLEYFPCLNDMREGLGAFLTNNRFILRDTEEPIDIRVSSSDMLYGDFSRLESGNAIYIRLSRQTTKSEITKWLTNNYKGIEAFYRLLPLPARSTGKPNFERDRFIAYLRDTRKMKIREISDFLGAKGEREYLAENAIKQALQDFPFRKVS